MTRHFLQSWAHSLGGEMFGGRILAPGPGHSAADRSLQITPSPAAPDGLLVHSFSGDDWRTCRDYVKRRLGLPGFSPSQVAKPLRIDPRPEPPANPAEDDEPRIKNALRLWDDSVDPRGTLAERYFASRSLDLPSDLAGKLIRFHPRCPMRTERFPAVICLVKNIVTDAPQGIHRTALMPNGNAVKRGKTYRLSLGLIKNGAIKLDSDDEIGPSLSIGEGLETTLAGRQKGQAPAWALLGTAGIEHFPILAGVDRIRIFAEADAASDRAIARCTAKWRAAARFVDTVRPDVPYGDLADELVGGAR